MGRRVGSRLRVGAKMSKKGSERLQVKCYFSFSGGLSAFEFWAVASTRSHFLLPFCRPFLFSRSFVVVVVGFLFFFVHFAQEEWNQMLRCRFRRRGHNKGIAIRASTGAREGRGGAPDASLSRPPRPF